MGMGLIMYSGGNTSGGFTWGRDGSPGLGALSGTGTVFLGISVLLFAFYLYFWHKKIAARRQRLLDEEMVISNALQDKKKKILVKQTYAKRHRPGKKK